MKAKTVKLNICECGFPTLADDIPLGTEYDVLPGSVTQLGFTCGGCRQTIHHIKCIWAERRGTSHAGFLPVEIFEILKCDQHNPL